MKGRLNWGKSSTDYNDYSLSYSDKAFVLVTVSEGELDFKIPLVAKGMVEPRTYSGFM